MSSTFSVESGDAAALRMLPSVDELIRSAATQSVRSEIGTSRLTILAREVIEELRRDVRSGSLGDDGITAAALLAEAGGRLLERWNQLAARGTKRVINATGVVVHTNLGRAPLSYAARQRLIEAAGYCNVEYDLASGKRGHRGARAEELLCEFAGAEAAVVVNNCAAAAFLVLSVFAAGKEVLLSRGELVEIGGDFRVPDVLARSGATLKEVGTTNRTKIADYESAITENTGVLLRVHPSNFRVVGFTAAPSTAELAGLAHDHGLVFIEDAGSGASPAVKDLGIADEPVIAESIKSGVDVVTFSGDKLLGGPQSGLIVGRRELIEKVRRHPLYRALRVDKLIYAALEATLESHLRAASSEEVPVLKMLSVGREELGRRARDFASKIRNETLRWELLPGFSAVGGGSAPLVQPETTLVALGHESLSAAELEEKLRRSTPPVITRIVDDKVMIDLRTVDESEEAELLRALAGA